jgi:nucleoside-diphosphate-sugar epimerase
MKIAIFGSTGHIAKSLIYYFSKKREYELYLFARSPEKLNKFIKTVEDDGNFKILSFDDYNNHHYDVIINCIGIKKSELESNFLLYFKVTENYDNLIIDYLLKNPEAIYINFSSGAVYGNDFKEPVSRKVKCKLDVNDISIKDNYKIVKINAEAKHRCMKDFNIVDIRIFSYFSRFIDLDNNYFICDLIKSIKHNKVFKTSPDNIVRDYIHPYDLFSLIEKIILKKNINDVFDAYSKKYVSKLQIIKYFKNEYNLKCEIVKNFNYPTITGFKKVYYSKNTEAKKIGYNPNYTSFECIQQEVNKILV